MTGLVLSPALWSRSSSHIFGFTTGNVDFLVARLVFENSTLTIQFLCDVSTSGSGEGGIKGVKTLERKKIKQSTRTQNPIIWGASLDQKVS